jgi:monoamine oxidase
MDADLIVVGAGASGLACAHDMADRGADVLVVEARDRIGGRIHTIRGFRDDPFEIGAMMVHGERAAVVDIARDAGLALEPPNWGSGGHSFVVMDGDVLPGGGLDGWWGAERAVADLHGPDVALDRFLNDLGWPRSRRALTEELFAQFWCADPGVLSAEGVTRVEDSWSSGHDNLIVRDGYDRIAEFLARGLRVELSAAVSNVSWRQGHVRITVGDGRSFDASAAVISVPPTVVAGGGLLFDPVLPTRKLRAAATIPLGGVIRVVAELVDPAPSTGTMIVVGDEGGFWSVSPGMVTVWIGGPSASRFSGSDPIEIALRARSAFPWLERTRIGNVLAADWLADGWSRGAYSYPRAGALDAPAIWGEPIEQTLFFCGEATCGDVHPATVHGAIESGRRAASEIASVG